MKILVTGATGVIGSRAIPMLQAAGHEVTAASRSGNRNISSRTGGTATGSITSSRTGASVASSSSFYK